MQMCNVQILFTTTSLDIILITTLKHLFVYLSIYVSLCVFADVYRGQKRVLDPLELEVVSCLTWVLGTESPERAASILKGLAFSRAKPMLQSQ